MFLNYFDEAIKELQVDKSKGPNPTLYIRDGEKGVVELSAIEMSLLPSVLEIDNAHHADALKRKKSGSGSEVCAAKRAHLGNDAAIDGAGVSHLQVYDTANSIGED